MNEHILLEPDNSDSIEKNGKPKQPVKVWKQMAPGDAAFALGRSVHYSSKPVNSNAACSGVRLAADDRPNLPFIALSTINADRRITDYLEGGAPASPPFNQAASVIEGKADSTYLGCDDAQKALVMSEAHVLDSAAVVGADLVDPRLRQVFMSRNNDDNDGQTVALTPLHSSPFSVELRKRLAAEKAAVLDLMPRPLAVLLVGGSNNQNVGRHINSMTSPLVFGAPQESGALREAMSIHYNGVDIRSLLPRSLALEFIAWRQTNRNDKGQIESTLLTRNEEASQIKAMARAVLAAADAIHSKQMLHQEHLGQITDDAVAPFMRGLLDPACRYKSWPKDFASRVLWAIGSFRPNQKSASLAQDADLDAFASDIEQLEQLR